MTQPCQKTLKGLCLGHSVNLVQSRLQSIILYKQLNHLHMLKLKPQRDAMECYKAQAYLISVNKLNSNIHSFINNFRFIETILMLKKCTTADLNFSLQPKNVSDFLMIWFV